MTRLTLLALLALSMLMTVAPSLAEQQDQLEKQIEEAQRGAQVAPTKGNWVPVPVPVSNPTIGSGLQAALLYLHPRPAREDSSPNATSGLVGMYTNTDSWFAGIFHDDYWAGDRYRFAGFLGYGDLNLKYYGIGDNPYLSRNPLNYELRAFFFTPKIQIRIPSTNHWFAGVQYLLIDSDVLFRTSQIHPILPDIRGHILSAGLGLLVTFDSRDDNYYPTSGQLFEAKWTNYGKSWGGDYSYDKYRAFLNHYQPILPTVVLALRARAEFCSGDTPFYDLSYLDMRGFARGRYQDNATFSMHAEGRYKFTPRWGVIGFLETGWYGEDFKDFSSDRHVVSYGGGLRWQVVKDKKMHLGLDMAFSTDEKAFYVQIGEQF